MAKYRITLRTTEQHEAIIDTADFDDLSDDAAIDEVAEFFDSLEEYRLSDYVRGDRTWINTIDTEFDDVYPVEED